MESGSRPASGSQVAVLGRGDAADHFDRFDVVGGNAAGVNTLLGSAHATRNRRRKGLHVGVGRYRSAVYDDGGTQTVHIGTVRGAAAHAVKGGADVELLGRGEDRIGQGSARQEGHQVGQRTGLHVVHGLARDGRGGGFARLALGGHDGHFFQAEGGFLEFEFEFVVASRGEGDLLFDGFLADILDGDHGFAGIHTLEFKIAIAVGRGVELLRGEHDDSKFNGYAGTLFQHTSAYARPRRALREGAHRDGEQQDECQHFLNSLHKVTF